MLRGFGLNVFRSDHPHAVAIVGVHHLVHTQHTITLAVFLIDLPHLFTRQTLLYADVTLSRN